MHSDVMEYHKIAPMDDWIQELRKHVPNISSLCINLSSLLKLYNFWKVITKTWKIFRDQSWWSTKRYNINIKCLSPSISTQINTDFRPHWLGWLEIVDSLKLWTDVFINKGDLSLLVPFIKYFVEFLILWEREPIPPITNLTCNKITISTSQVKQFIQYKVILLNITTVKNELHVSPAPPCWWCFCNTVSYMYLNCTCISTVKGNGGGGRF